MGTKHSQGQCDSFLF